MSHVKLLQQHGADHARRTHNGQYLPFYNAIIWLHRDCKWEKDKTVTHHCTQPDRIKCYAKIREHVATQLLEERVQKPHWRVWKLHVYDRGFDDAEVCPIFHPESVLDDVSISMAIEIERERREMQTLLQFGRPETKDNYFQGIHNLLTKADMLQRSAAPAGYTLGPAGYTLHVVSSLGGTPKHMLWDGFRALAIPSLKIPTLPELFNQWREVVPPRT